MKLYHYVHCPFCIRVRMALSFLKIEFDSIVVPYNDENTPLELMGVKMLPIFKNDQTIKNESLDIIQDLDSENKLNTKKVLSNLTEVNALIANFGKFVHPLAMPYWMWTAEFDVESRKYFQNKKEIKKGPFKNLVKNKAEYIKNLNKSLEEFEVNLIEFYKSNTLTLNDIIIASHLWGMYIVPEFQFSEKIHKYLQLVAKECQFNYHVDFWR